MKHFKYSSQKKKKPEFVEESIPKIRVCVRKRPANRKEINNNDIDILEIKGPNSLTVKELK